jgi:hypothetical protein
MQGAGIGSEVTLTKNLNHLKTVGLVIIQEIGGTHGGNEYTVLMPEEVGTTPSTPSRGSTPSSPTQFLGGLPPLETRPSRAGLNEEREESSASPNTSFKTINDDDDMRMLLEPLRATALEIGGEPAVSSERWAEVGKLLAEELISAAARAGQVNNVPAFFAEHLRRALGRAGKSAKIESGRKGEGERRRKPTSEERLKQIIETTRALHVGDMGYSEEDLISDVIFKAKRAELKCDADTIRRLLS